jgi:hypothetical protein
MSLMQISPEAYLFNHLLLLHLQGILTILLRYHPSQLCCTASLWSWGTPGKEEPV